MLALRFRRLTVSTALVVTALVSASGCIGCAWSGHTGEVRIETTTGAFAGVLAIRVELRDDDDDELQVFDLRRVAAGTFVPASCEDPVECEDYRVREDGSLPIATDGYRTLTYELEIVGADGTDRAQSGTTRREERTLGDFPCRERVVDAVIELA